MRLRALIAYCLLLLLAVLTHVVAPFPLAGYLLPFYMMAVPVLFGPGLRLSLTPRHIGLCLVVSVIFLVPSFLFFSVQRSYHFMGPQAILAQLVRSAIPEEMFFRGYLQEIFGNNIRAVLLVSLLFAGAHVPAFYFYRDAYALLTFFPSLVMGFLYLRTSNILPPVLFHFLANVVYLGFMI